MYDCLELFIYCHIKSRVCTLFVVRPCAYVIDLFCYFLFSVVEAVSAALLCRLLLSFVTKMAAGPLSAVPNTSTNNDGILIGDRVYSEVYLTISNSLIPEERLQPTPSMLDGLDLHTETDLRILGCELIQSAGILLRLPQVNIQNKHPVPSSYET